MISIKVNNRQLYIPADTSLVLEQNNNSFDLDNFGSDIIWTFDIPARKNADALESAHYVCVSNHKKYRCEILFNGVVIANGDLYIQSVSDEETVSCGVVLDGLGEEFGKRMLRENDYGDDVVISQPGYTIDQHRTNWVRFLQGSLEDDSVYKFFLFISEDFQKDNDDFGYHLGIRSTLRGLAADDYCSTWVNRIFYSMSGPIVTFLGNLKVGNENGTVDIGELFNKQGSLVDHFNGYCFAPAVRLDWLLRQVFRNAGYTVSGDFLNDSRIKNLYVQSLNAMDGNIRDLGLTEYFYMTGSIEPGGDYAGNCLPAAINEQPGSTFRRRMNYGTSVIFNFGFNVDLSGLVVGQPLTPTSASPWTRYDEVYMLLVRTVADATADKKPTARCTRGSVGNYVYGTLADATTIPSTYTDRQGRQQNIHGAHVVLTVNGICRINNSTASFDIIQASTSCYCVQLTASAAYSPNYKAGDVDIEGAFNAAAMAVPCDPNSDWVVELVKARIDTVTGPSRAYEIPGSSDIIHLTIAGYGSIEKVTISETIAKTGLSAINGSLNIYDIALRWRQHVPDISNGDFIKTICKAFGLSIYINPYLKEAQLSFFNDVLETDAIDITDYITSTERLEWEPRHITRTLDCVLGEKETSKDYQLDDVTDKTSLPQPYSEKNKTHFVSNENAYRRSLREKETSIYNWEQHGGNNRPITAGEGYNETDEEKIDIRIPNMRWVDEAKPYGQSTDNDHYVCEIAEKGNSALFDDDYDGKFDTILMQRHPRRTIHLGDPDGGSDWYIETANPTSLGIDGNTVSGAIDLSMAPNRKTPASDCVGERWLRRMLDFKADMERYSFQARLPLSLFLQLYQTQQPQHVAVCDEKRWIVVKNRRYMPTKISYEFGKGDYVLTTIECARQHFETA